VVVAPAHAFVDGVFKARAEAFQAHAHANLHKHIHDTGVLANRAVAHGAHLAIGQNLRHRIFGRWALLALVGAGQVRDVIRRVVVADVLQGRGHGFNQVVLSDDGHGVVIFRTGMVPLAGQSGGSLQEMAWALVPLLGVQKGVSFLQVSGV